MEINNGKKTPCILSLQNLLNSAAVLVTWLLTAALFVPLQSLSCPHGALMAHPNPHQRKRTVKLVTAHHPKASYQHFHCSYNKQRCLRGISLTPFYARALRFMNWLSQTIPQLSQLLLDFCKGLRPKISI